MTKNNKTDYIKAFTEAIEEADLETANPQELKYV